jgi:hypothetical protein
MDLMVWWIAGGMVLGALANLAISRVHEREP